LWRDFGGPQNDYDRRKSGLYLESLKVIRKSETKRRTEISGILISFTRWVDYFKDSASSLQIKNLISHTGKTAMYGSELSSSQAYG